MPRPRPNTPAFWLGAFLLALTLACDPEIHSAAEGAAEPEPVSEQQFVRAIIDGDQAVIRRALTQGVNPNARNKYDDTALIWAVNQGDAALAKTLLDRGANPNLTGSYGRTALHWAVRNGFPPLAELLIAAGAKPDARDEKRRTPMMDAAARDDRVLIGLLINSGADVDAVEAHGETALHLAVGRKARDAILTLLRAGANVELADREGDTPLSLALKRNLDDFMLSAAVLDVRPELKVKITDLVETRIVNKDRRPVFLAADVEAKIHELVNQERVQRGLRPLAYNARLAAVARGHSDNMAEQGFFNHVNKRGEDPTARAVRAGYPVNNPATGAYGIGENIFQGYTHRGASMYIEDGVRRVIYSWMTPEEAARDAVEGWMNSPGHRRNMLSPDYVKEGVGVAIDTASEKIYVTQNLQ